MNTKIILAGIGVAAIAGIIIEAGYFNLIGTGITADKNIASNIGFEAMLEINGLLIKVQK